MSVSSVVASADLVRECEELLEVVREHFDGDWDDLLQLLLLLLFLLLFMLLIIISTLSLWSEPSFHLPSCFLICVSPADCLRRMEKLLQHNDVGKVGGQSHELRLNEFRHEE